MAKTTSIPPRSCVRITLRHGGDAWNWAHYLRCSEIDLRKALQAVGDSENDVRHYLKQATVQVSAKRI